MSQPVILWDLSWPELAEKLREIKVALIPVGSTEQHGPNMTFETDTARAYEFAKLLGARLGEAALVVPPVPFGVSPHHLNFPGTISLEPETFMRVCEEIVRSLRRHGIKHFFFVNGHGGNRAALTLLMGRLRKDTDVRAAWTSFTSLAGDVIRERTSSPLLGHACENEVSQGLYLAPRTVKQDQLAAGKITEWGRKHWAREWSRAIEVAATFDEITSNGALGDASRASRELGEEIIRVALDRAEEFLRAFIAQDEGEDARGEDGTP